MPRPRLTGAPRVCILTETYYPVVGGGERQAQTLAEDLVTHGFETMVVTRRSSETLEGRETIGGVSVHRIRPVALGRWTRWLMLLWSFAALVRLRRQYDIVFVSGFKALGVSAVLTSRLFGKVCILKADSNGEMSGTFFRGGLRRMRMTAGSPVFRFFLAARNRVLRGADHFVAITAEIGREFEAHGVTASRIRAITNSVDTARFRPAAADDKRALRRRLGLKERDLILTYTGRLVTYKGVPLLVRVAERLGRERDDVSLVLLGSGGLDIHNCEAELRDYVRANGLADIVRFAGEVPNVHEYLQASDVFVLPTEEDAFPLSLIEAMACGVPVVSTPVGGIGEIVSDGENGLLVEAGSGQALYAALRRLIADIEWSASLGRAAAATVRSRYSRDIVAAMYIQLFTSAYDSPGPAEARVRV